MKLYMFRTVRLSNIRVLFTAHSAMVYVIQVCKQLSSRTSSILVLFESCLQTWWWKDELPETRRGWWQNKFVKLVHLVGFITKKEYHDLLRNIQLPTHAHTPKWRKLPTLRQKLRFSQRRYWLFQRNAVPSSSGSGISTLDLFKVFHMQSTIISSHLPYFTHSFLSTTTFP